MHFVIEDGAASFERKPSLENVGLAVWSGGRAGQGAAVGSWVSSSRTLRVTNASGSMLRRGAFLFGVLLVAPTMAGAADCLGPASADVRALMDAKKWDEAEVVAGKRIEAKPDDLDVRLDLVRVRVERSLRPGVDIDWKKAGVPTDADGRPALGTYELDPAKIGGAVQNRTFVDENAAAAAIRALDDVIAHWPKYLPAHLCSMDLWQHRRDHARLLDAVTRAASVFADEPARVEDLVHPAVEYVAEKRFDRAADVYLRLLDTFPGSGLLLSDLATTKIQSGRVREAQPLLEKAFVADPNDPIIALNLARVNRLLDELDAAEQWTKKWHDLDPDNTASLFDLATLAMRNGPKASLPAWDGYLAANEAHPDDPIWREWGRQVRAEIAAGMDEHVVRELTQQLLTGGNGAVALPLIAWLRARSPTDLWPGWMRAAVLEKEGQPGLAAEQLLAIAPRVSEASETEGIAPIDLWWNLGRNLHASGQGAAAVPWLEKVEAKDPERPALQYFLGNVHASLGHVGESRRYWQQCLERPNNAEYARWCRSNLTDARPPQSR